MPSLTAPPVRRAVQKGVSKNEFDKLPPPLKRVAKVNRDADKNKWGTIQPKKLKRLPMRKGN